MWGTRCAKLKALLWPVAVVTATATAATQQGAPAPAPAPAVTVIVFDASRDMGTKLGEAAKIATIRSELTLAIAAYQDRLSFGLVAFGHRKASNCADTEVLAKPGEFTAETQEKLVGAIKPKGEAAIGAAITEAAKLGQTGDARLDVVLVTGSTDSCKVDVCGTAEVLKQKAKGLRLHVIAYAADAREKLAPLSCIAERTGGQFLTAANDAELKQNLAIALGAVSATPQPTGIAVGPPGVAPAPEVPIAGTLLVPPRPQVTAVAPIEQGQIPAPGQSEAQKTARAGHTDMQKSVPPKTSGGGQPKIAQAVPPAHPVPVTFKALITESGPELQSGLIWRVFSAGAGANSARKLISTHRGATPTAALFPGEYLVNAAYGLSNLTKKIKVEGGKSLEETFVLNAGGLRLAATLANGEPLPAGSARFDILSDEEDQFGNRQEILGNAKPGIVIRLNAGAYHIVSTYGDANATVRADVTVEPGKLTEATIKHAAAPITFRLVQNPGGEAIADTHWSILTARGDLVKESAGALPTHVLAAGDYAVVARNSGLSYTRKFPVATGEAKQVEVVVESGPTSPEALQAIIDPPAPPDSGEGFTGSAPETGTAFGADPSATPDTDSSGGLLNPGILLRPRVP